MQNIGSSPGKAGSQDNLSYMCNKRTQKVYGLWNFEWKCCHNPTGSGIIAAETQGVLGGSSSQNVLKSSILGGGPKVTGSNWCVKAIVHPSQIIPVT